MSWHSIYEDLRFYVNFFQPVLKLIGKDQVDGKTQKRYDEAATPYQRLMRSPLISIETKASLCNTYMHLNPVTLRNRIDDKVAKLWKLVR